jgi:hypothetical protein
MTPSLADKVENTGAANSMIEGAPFSDGISL